MRKLKKAFAVILSVSLMMSQVSAVSFANEVTQKTSDNETNYELVLDCDLERDLSCTKTVHTHSEVCYELINATDSDASESDAKILKCDIDEHEHDDACYIVHEHREDCYEKVEIVEENKIEEDFKLTGTDSLVGVAVTYDVRSSSVASESNAVAVIDGTEYDTLSEAVEAANETDDSDTIELLKDFEFDAAKALSITGEITITGDYTISRGDYTGTMFTVPAGASLILEELTIDGNNDWIFLEDEFINDVKDGVRRSNSSVKYTEYEEGGTIAAGTMITIGGKVVLDDGATIKNHVGCALFSVNNNAELIMNDATITHNTKNGTPLVASVSAGGKWIINDGAIISNNHTHVGNGILSYMCGTTVMNGGEIYGNTGVDCNGCVMMLYGGSANFTMNGGHIYDNGATYGSNNGWNPAFYVYGNGAKFIMNDGIIEGNFSESIPGIANNGSNGLITLNGGKILNSVSGRGFTAKDVYAYCPVVIDSEVDSATNGFYNNVTNTGTLNGDSWFYSYEMTYSGGGIFDGNVTVQSGAETTMADGSWLNGMVIVKAVGNDSTLTVKKDATIDGIQVRVLNSVESGAYTDETEAAAAQAASYVEEDGANVVSPVLYYHRLTSAQQNNIVVTYDYNGGLDESNWSGCQITSAESFIPVSPTPFKDGYEFAGWGYAVEEDAESLSMEITSDYNGETISESIRLIAKWVRPAIPVTIIVQDATYIEGTPIPTEFSYTVDVENLDLDITFSVEGNVINAIVAEKDGYVFTVIPGTLTLIPDSGNNQTPEGGEDETPTIPEGGEGETPTIPEGGEGETPANPEGGEGETPTNPEGGEGETPTIPDNGDEEDDEPQYSRPKPAQKREEEVVILIEDAETPLAAVPEASEEMDFGVLGAFDILDNMVPLAALPATGSSTAMWLVLSVLSALGLVGTSFADRRKRK